ncbi:MAG TPA: lipoyl(octanoyl) transferase LipB [Solirubrobacteraceae bacterium]|nr:lipoyl(octanoyl) transferase LipB [Solirubrobacteraceae bacterium]
MTSAGPSPDELLVCDLGTVPYGDALAIQEQVRALRQAGELPDTLLLLEHPPVFTRGRRSGAGDLPFDERFYRERGVDVVDTDRGGRATYHGPGQLVGYPIMSVCDVGAFLRTIERAIVDALAREGVAARSRHAEGIDYTGVWVEERKIASIGLHVAHGVATHGFAVNVDGELEPFSWIVACGLTGVRMTSLALELGVPARPAGALGPTPLFERFRARMSDSFCGAHGRPPRRVSGEQLAGATANHTGAAPAGAEPIEETSAHPAGEAVPA